MGFAPTAASTNLGRGGGGGRGSGTARNAPLGNLITPGPAGVATPGAAGTGACAGSIVGGAVDEDAPPVSGASLGSVGGVSVAGVMSGPLRSAVLLADA